MPDDPVLWLFALAWFLGGFVNGVSGLGFAMVALSVVAGHADPAILVPSTCVGGLLMALGLCKVYWRSTRWSAMKSLVLGSLPGTLAGLAVLLVMPAAVLEVTAGALMELYVLWQFCHARLRPGGESFAGGFTAGFAMGFITASISFGGPPLAVYALHAGWTKEETLGTLGVFATFTGLLACLTHAAAGLYTEALFRSVLWGAPGCLAGMALAFPIARRVNQELFRKILLLVIAAAGLVCLRSGAAILLA